MSLYDDCLAAYKSAYSLVHHSSLHTGQWIDTPAKALAGNFIACFGADALEAWDNMTEEEKVHPKMIDARKILEEALAS